MTYQIVKVGIPIRTSDISPEYLAALSDIKTNPRSRALVTAGYFNMGNDQSGWYSQPRSDAPNSPAGHELLFEQFKFLPWAGDLKQGVINTMGFIWALRDPEGNPRNIRHICRELIKILDQAHDRDSFDRVYILAAGSPRFGDSITLELAHNGVDHVIIDTASSYDIAVEAIQAQLGPMPAETVNYIHEFIRRGNKQLNPGMLNMFNSLQQGYEINGEPVLARMFQDVAQWYDDSADFFAVHVDLEGAHVERTTLGQARANIDYFYKNPKSLLFGIYSKTLE